MPVLLASKDMISSMEDVKFLLLMDLPTLDVPLGTGIIKFASLALKDGSSTPTESALPFLTNVPLMMPMEDASLATKDTLFKMVPVSPLPPITVLLTSDVLLGTGTIKDVLPAPKTMSSMPTEFVSLYLTNVPLLIQTEDA